MAGACPEGSTPSCSSLILATPNIATPEDSLMIMRSFQQLFTWFIIVAASTAFIESLPVATKRATTLQGTPIFSCGDRNKADVIFVIHFSSDSDHQKFDLLKEFVYEMISSLDVRQEKVRVAVVSYGSKVYPVSFLSRPNSKAGVLKKVAAIKYRQGRTNTHWALHFVNTRVMTSRFGDRENVGNVIVVVTDNVSANQRRTARLADVIKSVKAVTIISIGVGDRVKQSEVTSLASRPGLAHFVSDFNNLKKIEGIVKKEICFPTMAFTSTPEPTTFKTPSTAPDKQKVANHLSDFASKHQTTSSFGIPDPRPNPKTTVLKSADQFLTEAQSSVGEPQPPADSGTNPYKLETSSNKTVRIPSQPPADSGTNPNKMETSSKKTVRTSSQPPADSGTNHNKMETASNKTVRTPSQPPADSGTNPYKMETSSTKTVRTSSQPPADSWTNPNKMETSSTKTIRTPDSWTNQNKMEPPRVKTVTTLSQPPPPPVARQPILKTSSNKIKAHNFENRDKQTASVDSSGYGIHIVNKPTFASMNKGRNHTGTKTNVSQILSTNNTFVQFPHSQAPFNSSTELKSPESRSIVDRQRTQKTPKISSSSPTQMDASFDSEPYPTSSTNSTGSMTDVNPTQDIPVQPSRYDSYPPRRETFISPQQLRQNGSTPTVPEDGNPDTGHDEDCCNQYIEIAIGIAVLVVLVLLLLLKGYRLWILKVKIRTA